MLARSMVWVAVVAGTLALGACGEAEQQGDPAPSTAASAHPFAVGEVASHYELSIAGRGTDEQAWDPEMGADEPYVVVDAGGQIVVASVVPWEPMESSLEWASASGDRDPETFVLDDGRPAAYGKGADGGWDDLVIEVGPTEALRIATENGTRDNLIELARHIDSDGDPAAAPTVADPPDSWEVLGSVQPGALMALRAQVYPSSNASPGPTSGYGIGWVDQRLPVENSSLSSLAVMVLPGDAADLDALATRAARFGESDQPARLEVDGRPALLFDGTGQFGGGLRSLVTNDETGALVFVTAFGEALPTEQELVSIASSVRPIDEAEWERFEIETFGGPDLVADPGETELARGDADGVEWLLQTSTMQVQPGAFGPTGGGPTGVRVDECLKLSILQHSCPSPSGGGEDGSVFLWTSSLPYFDDLGFPEYVVVTTSQPEARRMRVTIGATVVEADVHNVPGGSVDSIGAAVAFIELPEASPIAVCNPAPPPPPDGLEIIRIDLLDDSGNVIGCAGM